MPYYQYDPHLGEKSDKDEVLLSKVEAEEEKEFNEVLNKKSCKFITLLDLFAPSGFKQMRLSCYSDVLYPILPQEFRLKLIKMTESGLEQGKLKPIGGNVCSKNDQAKYFEKLKSEENDSFSNHPTYAKIKYDCVGNPITSNPVLNYEFDVWSFIKYMFETKEFPLELLHFKIFKEFYERWQSDKVSVIEEKLLEMDAWPVFDVVCLLAKTFFPREAVQNGLFITEVTNRSLHTTPVRHQGNPINVSPSYKGVKGRIDREVLPDILINYKDKWNYVLKSLQDAMSFKEIVYNSDNPYFISNKVKKESLIKWASDKFGSGLLNSIFLADALGQDHELVKDNVNLSKKEIIEILNKLINEVKRRAKKEGISCSPFPCRKEHFYELMERYHSCFCKAPTTLQDYLKQTRNMRFESGRGKKKNVLKDLFPEYLLKLE